MKTYEIHYPDGDGIDVVEYLTEEQILDTYFTTWSSAMIRKGKLLLVTPEACIQDWALCNFATEVTMTTVTKLGKYEVVQEAGSIKVLRNGEEWRDCTGDNLVYALLAKIEDLNAALHEVENCLVCAAIGDPMEVVNNSLEIIKGHIEQ